MDAHTASTSDERRRGAVVVVGYDGSPAARAAVAHAARRAAPGGKLIVVHAFAPPSDWLGSPGYDRVLAEHEERGRAVLATLPAELGGVACETELIGRPPAEALAAVAEVRDADEIVVGSRGFGPLRAVLGSVSHQLLHTADRPVVVIPEQAVGRLGEAPAAAAEERR